MPVVHRTSVAHGDLVEIALTIAVGSFFSCHPGDNLILLNNIKTFFEIALLSILTRDFLSVSRR